MILFTTCVPYFCHLICITVIFNIRGKVYSGTFFEEIIKFQLCFLQMSYSDNPFYFLGAKTHRTSTISMNNMYCGYPFSSFSISIYINITGYDIQAWKKYFCQKPARKTRWYEDDERWFSLHWCPFSKVNKCSTCLQ